MADRNERIAEIERQLSELPSGSVVTKKVSGRTYFYHRTSKDGRRHEQYVPAEQVEALRHSIERRRALAHELKELREPAVKSAPPCRHQQTFPALELRTNVLHGDSLINFAAGIASWQERSCIHALRAYLEEGRTDRVFVLYGLRRTGKTTLIRQAILHMTPEQQRRCAFIQVASGNTLADINTDLRALRDAGFGTVFVDEATLMDDFVEGAALFSDVYAAGGMHIVLSGTDSLGFLFAEDEQLYDRCILLHTTFIPYGEFERVLGLRGLDVFIRFGGTMSMEGRDYNHASTFASDKAASEYVDSAIAHNIQHSLRCYQAGGHFRALRDLYEAGELTDAINRVVEDINHSFAVSTLTRVFKSSDLSISARNLRSDCERPTDVLDRIDVAEVTARLARALEIRNAGERSVPIEPAHAREIKEYLDLLDVTRDIPVVDMSDLTHRQSHTAVALPGLRYSQAEALVQSLLEDAVFADLSAAERKRVLDRVRSEVMGRMLEDIVMLETMSARPSMRVFKLQFRIGEFDMVVYDPEAVCCEIYEVKHSARRHPAQRRHLLDEENRSATEFRYGTITRTVVLYRGEDCEEDGVCYRNVERYLIGLQALSA